MVLFAKKVRKTRRLPAAHQDHFINVLRIDTFDTFIRVNQVQPFDNIAFDVTVLFHTRDGATFVSVTVTHREVSNGLAQDEC